MTAAADALLAALQTDATPRRRTIAAVEDAHKRVEPHLVGRPERVPRLCELLDELARDGSLSLSRHKRLDRLPESVTLTVLASKPARTPGRLLPPLHPELAAARAPVSPGWSRHEVDAILRVNNWLVQEGGVQAPVVALRERSFELYDDDKHLERLNRLFARGVLSHAVLRTVATPPPFPWWQVGERDAIIFVENAATFASLVAVLGAQKEPDWGFVGFASGEGFSERLPFVRHLPGPPIQSMHYFGDIDRAGLLIAAKAAAAALKAGLPPLEPELRLYQALLNVVAVNDAAATAADLPPACRKWLTDALARHAAAVIGARGLLPQEALSRVALARILGT